MIIIETKSIAPSMKKQIDGIRTRHGHLTASHAFASLYIWQEDMGLSVHLQEDFFAVKCAWRGKNAWFFPCGGVVETRAFIAQIQAEQEICFCYLREEDVLFLEREFPGRFQITERESDHEYLYSRGEQEMLQGRKFSGIRNHIHRAEADHALKWELLSAANVNDALAISRTWERQSDGPNGLGDRAASERLFLNWENLDARGVVVTVDGEPYAVVAGYPLSTDMFDISTAKQKDYLSGLSVYAKHALISSLPETYSVLNVEEDLGIEGLRTMKKQMRPIGQIKMYEGR